METTPSLKDGRNDDWSYIHEPQIYHGICRWFLLSCCQSTLWSKESSVKKTWSIKHLFVKFWGLTAVRPEILFELVRSFNGLSTALIFSALLISDATHCVPCGFAIPWYVSCPLVPFFRIYIYWEAVIWRWLCSLSTFMSSMMSTFEKLSEINQPTSTVTRTS